MVRIEVNKMVFKESENIELKSVVIDDIKKEIIAFANCNGGIIYIGVEDDGTVTGLNDPDGTALQISNMVRDAIKPDLTMFVHYKTLMEDGKEIVEISVQQGTERPYYIAKKGLRPEGVYVRQGYSSVSASNTLIRKMIKETDGDHFEDMRSLNQNLTFHEALKQFSKRKLPFQEAQMKILGLMTHDGIYTNLGLLLSDQCVHTIKVAAFEGHTQDQFKDRKEFSGSLFKQMEDVYQYLDFYNSIHSTFKNLDRIDQRDYPEMAMREALLNLLIHREYAFHASSFIRLYDDRLEFTSIGGLVNGVTLDDVMMGISVCRNVKLANIFYCLELIEAYGTGISKIMNAYANSTVKPKIETSDNAFKIILPNLNSQSHPTHDISQEEEIIGFAKNHQTFTRKDIQKAFGLSQTTCIRLLSHLVKKGKIIKEGHSRNTYYQLVK